jgi:hypothetical protein
MLAQRKTVLKDRQSLAPYVATLTSIRLVRRVLVPRGDVLRRTWR